MVIDLSPDCELTHKIMGAAFEVRKKLGRWLNESAYERAMQIELALQGIESKCQVEYPVIYKGHNLNHAYKIDMLVEDCVCIEFKTVSVMTERELSQIVNYLRYCNIQVGYLMNFRADDFCIARIPVKEDINDHLYLDKGIYRVANFADYY